MDVLTENILRKMGISHEQFEREIEKAKLESVTKNDIETLGNASLTSFLNQDELGGLVMSLFIQNNDLATVVMELQTQVDRLRGIYN